MERVVRLSTLPSCPLEVGMEGQVKPGDMEASGSQQLGTHHDCIEQQWEGISRLSWFTKALYSSVSQDTRSFPILAHRDRNRTRSKPPKRLAGIAAVVVAHAHHSMDIFINPSFVSVIPCSPSFLPKPTRLGTALALLPVLPEREGAILGRP